MVLNIPQQLSLPIYFPDDETLESFYPGNNGQLLNAIRASLERPGDSLYFWSSKGGGRSHLLHASCAEMSARGEAVSYLPMERRHLLKPELLEGMEYLALVCVDNIEVIAGDREWEVALFDLYNRVREQEVARLFIAGNRTPRQLSLGLPDLVSRLEWGPIYKLLPLADGEKLAALKMRAHLRGFDLSEDVGHFLLKRLKRDLRTLFVTLDRLDQASITAQRKLTIPFVKKILGL